jgi:hypothetical protein
MVSYPGIRVFPAIGADAGKLTRKEKRRYRRSPDVPVRFIL